jgi:hypothetical protein
MYSGRDLKCIFRPQLQEWDPGCFFFTTPYFSIYSFGSVYSKKACLTGMATAIRSGEDGGSSSSNCFLGGGGVNSFKIFISKRVSLP